MSEPLDDEKLEALGRWATSLQGDARAEVAAAGRAITMLVDEVDRLQRLVRLIGAVEESAAPAPAPDPVAERTLTPEQRSFRERLASRSVLPLRPKASGDPAAERERASRD